MKLDDVIILPASFLPSFLPSFRLLSLRFATFTTFPFSAVFCFHNIRTVHLSSPQYIPSPITYITKLYTCINHLPKPYPPPLTPLLINPPHYFTIPNSPYTLLRNILHQQPHYPHTADTYINLHKFAQSINQSTNERTNERTNEPTVSE